MGNRTKGTDQLCKVCNIRLTRYKTGACESCHFRTLAEGTQEKYGLATEPQAWAKWREQAKEYNELARKGLFQKDIAALWGMDISRLRVLVYRMKAEAGIKVVSMARSKKDSYVGPATAKVRPRNTHGGGKWGVSGCECDPCVTVRKARRKEMELNRDQRNKARIAQLEARVAELEALLAKKKRPS